MITQEHLKEILEYNIETGVLNWKEKRNSRALKGSRAGGLHPNGSIVIGINGKYYLAHRLAWLYVYGEFPKKNIDHINHNRTDNRIKNLRDVNNTENLRNCGLSCKNTSGYSGVSYSKTRRKWIASVKYNQKSIYIGGYDTPEEAAEGAISKRLELGFHRNHGKNI